MKITAARQGITLPPVWLLIRWLFLWENHRQPLPGVYAGLLAAIYTPAGTQPYQRPDHLSRTAG